MRFGSFCDALLRVARLEVSGVFSRPKEWVTGLLLPLFWCVVLALTFGDGLMTRLPVGVVDLDLSSTSRAAIERVEALPSVRSVRFASIAEANDALARGATYGTIVVPPDWERDNLRGTGSALSLQLNKTYYAVGTILEVDLKSALAAARMEEAAVKLTQAGGTFAANAGRMRVTVPDVDFEGNTAFNFFAYLLPTLLPGVLALGAALMFVSSTVREWRDGGLDRFFEAARGSATAVVLGKLLPWVLFFGLASTAWVGYFAGVEGWSATGPVALWIAGGWVLVLAMAGLSVLFTAISPTWVIAVSATVCLIAPTFPFTGFSFPLEAMTPGAAFFGELLPLTHYLRLQSEVWVLGSPVETILATLATLALFPLVFFAAGTPLLAAKWRGQLRLEAAARELARLDAPEAKRTEALEREAAASHPTGFLDTFGWTLRASILNRDTFAVFAGAVAFYLIFYGWPYGNQQIERVPVAVADLDGSSAARRLIAKFDAASASKIFLVTHDAREAEDAYRRGKTDVVVTIPEGFEERLARGLNTTIHVLGNGAYPVKARAVQASLAAIVSESGVLEEASLRSPGLPVAALGAAALRAPGLIVDYRYNTNSGYANYTVPMVGPVIIQAVMLMGITMALGGWLAAARRPRAVADALRRPLTGGFALFSAFWFIAFFWFLYMEGFAFWAMDYGNLVNVTGTVAAGFFFTGAVAALGTAVTLVIGTNAWTTPAVVIVSAPVLFLSGAVWPVEGITNPAALGLAQLLPTSPGIAAIAAASQDGATLHAILPACAHLSGLMLLYLLLAYAAARRLDERDARSALAGHRFDRKSPGAGDF